MGIVNLFGGLTDLFRKSSPSSSLDVLRDMLKGGQSGSGKIVNEKTAMEVMAVFACMRVLADGIAQVPLKLYQESSDGKSRLPAKTHPLYKILHRRPNSWQTSFEFREMMMIRLVLLGNFYAYIVRGRLGIIELIPLVGHMKPVQDENFNLTYKYTGKDGRVQLFPAKNIWHVRGPSWDGIVGLEIVRIAREAIGLAIATEEHHAKLHANGANPGGMISVDGTLDDKQHKQLTDWLKKEHIGSENSNKTMLMDRAAKFVRFAMTGVDAQHLETRRYQVEEVCRAMRVMPIMVGISDKATTYASAEQMFLHHVVHTLSPWYERIEQSVDCNLLGDKEMDDGFYAKFIEEALLRGAMKDTAEYLVKMTSAGLMTRNEGRGKLDLNPLPGLDEPLTPVNMQIGTDPEPETEQDPKPVDA